MFAIGLGMAMHYGHAWYQLPKYSAEDVAASTELNLTMDLKRRMQSAPPLSEAEQQQLRARVRADLEAEIALERKRVKEPALYGLLLLVVGIGQMWFIRRMQRKAG
jgi:hypothetical protein